MEWYYIVLIVIASLLIVLIGVSIGLAFYSVELFTHPHGWTRERQKKYNHEQKFDLGEGILERKDTIFVMKDGYIIHADYSIKDPKKWVVLCHGHSVTREGMVRYAKILYDLGYSVLLYDERGQGDNAKVEVTMGYKESEDLVEVFRFLRDGFGYDISIGVLGVSMGGATSIIATSKGLDSKFIVCDCAYADYSLLLKHQIHGRKVYFSFLIMPFIDMILKTKYHYGLKDVSAINFVENVKCPTIFIHGKKDAFTPYFHSVKLYEKAKCEKYLELYEERTHADCCRELDRYKKMLIEFFDKIGF